MKPSATLRKKTRTILPIHKLKDGSIVSTTRADQKLKNKEFIFEALWQSLIDHDLNAFREILSTHLEVVNKAKIAKKAKISRRTLHRMLAKNGNPTL